MTDMPKTLADVLDDIIKSRGGADVFSAAQLVAARGLARVLGRLNDGDVSKASSITTLEAMLPPLPSPPAKGPQMLEIKFVDDHLAKLTDEELVQLEAIAARLSGPAEALAGGQDTTVAELLRLNEQLREMVKRADDRVRIAEQSEATYKRMFTQASDALLQDRQTSGVSEQPAQPETAPAATVNPLRAIPDNVVPLRDPSPFAGLAMATNGGGGPPGVLFNAANPKGNLPEY